MDKKSVDIPELVERIADLVRVRMRSSDVVSIEDLRTLNGKMVAPTILIIEDDEFIRGALRRLFEMEHYRVLVASDATELSEVLHDTVVDLILLDVGLPWINGFELAEMMKANSILKSVPLVFISGHSDVQAIKRGFSVGAHDYITKPFEIETVKRTIATLLQLK